MGMPIKNAKVKTELNSRLTFENRE